MKKEDILETIGLKDKEAKVYLACLEMGQETAFNIAKRSKVKRSTVYFVLEKLVQKGFASLKQTPKASYYSVISPTKLLLKVESHKDALEKVLPELETIFRNQSHKPKVEIYEGRDGVKLIYREMAENLKTGKEVLYFGSTKHFLEEYQDLLDMWVAATRNKRYHAREILIKKELENSDYLQKIAQNANPNHQIRFFPRGIEFIENDNMIFGSKLAIFSLKKEVFVILIESENIANSYRNLFEMAWRVAKKN